MKWREQQRQPCTEELRQRDIAYRWKMPVAEVLTEQERAKVGQCWSYGIGFKERLEGLFRNACVKSQENKKIDRSTWGMPEEGIYLWGQFKTTESKDRSKQTPIGPALSDGQFFDNLKAKGIDGEILCILAQQGITTSEMLKQCTQQALATVGIRLSDAIKLKKI